jgi:ribosomal protein L11 methylase PrmA
MLTWITAVLMTTALAPAPQTAAPRAPDPAGTARITVLLPTEETELKVDGVVAPGYGDSRRLVLTPTATPDHEFEASWEPNAYTRMHRTTRVAFAAGDAITIDLSVESPEDRAEVIFVATPYDVADAMVALAKVTPDDVVFELGCGDGRIVIAAMKHGARKGVGIDISPDLVEQSRGNAQRAGVADRLEIRQGDIFDDQVTAGLADATVVLLYMGEEVNLMLRPRLLRLLKPGARIVSHRFLMGSWAPDRTETVVSANERYAIHLWVVKETDKRP